MIQWWWKAISGNDLISGQFLYVDPLQFSQFVGCVTLLLMTRDMEHSQQMSSSRLSAWFKQPFTSPVNIHSSGERKISSISNDGDEFLKNGSFRREVLSINNSWSG